MGPHTELGTYTWMQFLEEVPLQAEPTDFGWWEYVKP